MKISLFNLIKISIFVIHSYQLNAKTKPVQGIIISDSGVYLSAVKITSFPSAKNTLSDTDGFFYLDVPIEDRSLIFNIDGYNLDTLDVILFRNETVVEMIKIVEVDYLDSVDTSVKLRIDKIIGRNIYYFNKDDIAKKGVSLFDRIIFQENTITSFDKVDGEKTFTIKGNNHKNYDILYDDIKIDYLSYPLVDLSLFGEEGVSEIIITNGGYCKEKVSLGTINYIPKINYNNQLSFSQVSDTENENSMSSYASAGIDIATINGGFSKREGFVPHSDTTDSEVITRTSSYFSNIGLTNKTNFELIAAGSQNKNEFYNIVSNDSLELKTNHYITRIEQWHPFTGRISIYGLYQERLGLNYNSFDTLLINDRANIFGFLYEKEFSNYSFAFSTITNMTFADWVMEGKSLLIDRQNSIFTGSTQILFNRDKRNIYLKNIKVVYSKERTTDIASKISNIEFESNNWDYNSFYFSTDIGFSKGEKDRSINFSIGEIYSTPNMEHTIMGSEYLAPITINKINRIRPEYLSAMEFDLFIREYIEKYQWSYSLNISGFNYNYKEKIKHIQLLGSKTSFPVNLGNATISGFDIRFNLNPYINRFTFSSTISKYYFNNILKFQYIPESSIKNEIVFNNKIVNIKFIISSYGKRSRTLLNKNKELIEYDFNPFNHYTIHLSKYFNFKRFGFALGITGENINDEISKIRGVSIDDRKITFDISVTVQ